LNKKIIVLFQSHTDFEFFYRNEYFCLELIKKFENIKFLNLNLNLNLNKRAPKKFQKYFYDIKNINEFKLFLNKYKTRLCISFIKRKLENINIFINIKKFNIILTEINRSEELRDTKYFFDSNFLRNLQKFKKIFIINFNFILYSTFYYFNILPKVDYLFHFNDSIDDQIGYSFSDSYKYSLINIFKKKFLKRNIFFKKTYLINSKTFNELSKNHIQNKYIVFLDSCFDHSDRREYDSKPNDVDKQQYYSEIYNTFKTVKNFVFLVHPNSNIYEIKKFFKKISVVKFKTRYYLTKSKLVIFHESSSVLDAIYLKKNIVSVESNYLGEYFNFRNKLYSNFFGIKSINLSYKKNQLNFNNLKKINFFTNKKKFLISSKHKRISFKNILKKLDNLNYE
jgi:hypothetical protein